FFRPSVFELGVGLPPWARRRARWAMRSFPMNFNPPHLECSSPGYQFFPIKVGQASRASRLSLELIICYGLRNRKNAFPALRGMVTVFRSSLTATAGWGSRYSSCVERLGED